MAMDLLRIRTTKIYGFGLEDTFFGTHQTEMNYLMLFIELLRTTSWDVSWDSM